MKRKQQHTKGALCAACHRTDPPGGVRLTEQWEWVCHDMVGCAEAIAAALRREEPPACGRCNENVPLSTWGKYRGIYCDTCAGEMARERMGIA